jgi:hypothetical protein
VISHIRVKWLHLVLTVADQRQRLFWKRVSIESVPIFDELNQLTKILSRGRFCERHFVGEQLNHFVIERNDFVLQSMVGIILSLLESRPVFVRRLPQQRGVSLRSSVCEQFWPCGPEYSAELQSEFRLRPNEHVDTEERSVELFELSLNTLIGALSSLVKQGESAAKPYTDKTSSAGYNRSLRITHRFLALQEFYA